MIIKTKYNGYSPDGRRLYCKGGGSVKYDNLEDLYAIQAEQARSLMDQANKNVYPAYNELLDEARNSGSIANQEVAAGRAAADVASAQGGAKKQLEQQLSSMGVNPNDQKFTNTMASMDLDAAAQSAAAQTGARDKTRELGFAKMTDTVNAGMGIGSNAVAALNSAGNTAGSIANLQMGQQQMHSQAMGNIAALGTRMLGFKAGGLVPRGCAKPMRKYAGGGIIGAMGGVKPPAPPASGGAKGPSMAGAAGSAMVGGAGKLGGGIETVGNLIGKVAPEAGNAVSSFGAGLRLGGNATPAIEAYKGAQAAQGAEAAAQFGSNFSTAVNGGATAAEGVAAADAAAAAAGGAEAAGAAAAGAEAAGTAATAMEAGASLAGTLGAAMPWIGGALLIGSALDLFADGGEVEEKKPRLVDAVDARKGGYADGPGGPKDDMIPAMLSAGEFVMPVGAVKLYGIKELEKMRARGLRHEKQMGIA